MKRAVASATAASTPAQIVQSATTGIAHATTATDESMDQVNYNLARLPHVARDIKGRLLIARGKPFRGRHTHSKLLTIRTELGILLDTTRIPSAIQSNVARLEKIFESSQELEAALDADEEKAARSETHEAVASDCASDALNDLIGELDSLCDTIIASLTRDGDGGVWAAPASAMSLADTGAAAARAAAAEAVVASLGAQVRYADTVYSDRIHFSIPVNPVKARSDGVPFLVWKEQTHNDKGVRIVFAKDELADIRPVAPW